MTSLRSLLTLCRQRGIPCRERHLAPFERFLALLAAETRHVNLTSVDADDDPVTRHILDSLLFGPLLPRPAGLRVVDVGCGAGLPTVPLAVVYPGLQVFACDAALRKIEFLRYACSSLGLFHVEPLHARMEDVGHDPALRGTFDVSVARAFGPIRALLECALPLVRPGGLLVVATTRRVLDEAGDLTGALGALGSAPPRLRPYVLPGPAARHFVHALFDKTGQTPARYPRKPAQIAKKPLS